MKKKIPRLINLPKIMDYRGNLSFVEGDQHIPYSIKRAYWIYDVPGGEIRGGHAFREQEEFIIALSGSFDVILNTGKLRKRFLLNRSYFGLYVPSGVWRTMANFSTNSLALVLASTRFNHKDYIRDYSEFISLTKLVGTINQPVPQNYLRPIVPNPVFYISKLDNCRVVLLDKNHRDKGNITVIQNQDQIPFDIARVYYLYDVPGGEERGGHAHKELSQLIIAASGSFDVVVNDGKETKTITLNRPYQGLYLVPGIWRELINFSSGSSCLVLASHTYSELDYIRDYLEFIRLKAVTL